VGATAIGTQGGFERERIDYIEIARDAARALIDSASTEPRHTGSNAIH